MTLPGPTTVPTPTTAPTTAPPPAPESTESTASTDAGSVVVVENDDVAWWDDELVDGVKNKWLAGGATGIISSSCVCFLFLMLLMIR